MDNQIYMVRQKKGDKANLFNSFEQILNKNFSIITLWWYVRNRKLVEKVSGAKTVPENHANINKTGKSNENKPISAIESIGNISKNAIQIS